MRMVPCAGGGYWGSDLKVMNLTIECAGIRVEMIIGHVDQRIDRGSIGLPGQFLNSRKILAVQTCFLLERGRLGNSNNDLFLSINDFTFCVQLFLMVAEL